jgi:hypothetical protein
MPGTLAFFNRHFTFKRPGPSTASTSFTCFPFVHSKLDLLPIHYRSICGQFSLSAREVSVNPQWMQIVFGAVQEVMKICPHGKKVSAYGEKRAGQFYKRHYCGHKFKEKGK